MNRTITELLRTSKRKKTVSFRGASPPWPPPGALPPGPPLRAPPQTPVIGSRSRARHARGSSPPKRHTLSSPLSPTPHFGGVHSGVAMNPKCEVGQDFCIAHLPQFSLSYVYLLGRYRVDKQMPLKTYNALRYSTMLAYNHIYAARCIITISVCPSICLSHAYIVSKQMNVGSWRLYWPVAQCI